MQEIKTSCPLVSVIAKSEDCRKSCEWYNSNKDFRIGCAIHILPEIAASLKTIADKPSGTEGNE